MGCRNVVIGCGIFALLAVVALAVGGLFVFKTYAPTVTQFLNLSSSIQKSVAGIQNVQVNVSTTNGKTVMRIRAQVPFNPNNAIQAENTAHNIAKLVQDAGIKTQPAANLEVQLYQNQGDQRLEHTYRFDLSKPLPAAQNRI